MTANEQIRDLTIERAHYVEWFKNSEVEKYQEYLDKSDKEIGVVMAAYAGVDNWTEARQAKLLTEIAEVEIKNRAQFEADLSDDLKAFAAMEAAWQVKAIVNVMSEYGDFEVTKPKSVFKAAKDQFLMFDNGETISLEDYIGRTYPGREDIITQTLQQGFLLGKTAGEMTRHLLGTEKGSYTDGTIYRARSWTEGMVRTTITHTASVVRDEMYEANSDLLRGYQWVSTLDGKTSAICIDRDLRVWLYSGKPKDQEKLLPGPVKPPAHRGCRSATVPLVKSWKELGIDIDEMPESTRSGLSGQVPEGQTYTEWLKNAGEYRQKEVLGITRYNAWKNGEISIDKFYQDGRKLTLEELGLK